MSSVTSTASWALVTASARSPCTSAILESGYRGSSDQLGSGRTAITTNPRQGDVRPHAAGPRPGRSATSKTLGRIFSCRSRCVIDLKFEQPVPVRRVLERGRRDLRGARANGTQSNRLRAHPIVTLLRLEVLRARPQDHQPGHAHQPPRERRRRPSQRARPWDAASPSRGSARVDARCSRAIVPPTGSLEVAEGDVDGDEHHRDDGGRNADAHEVQEADRLAGAGGQPGGCDVGRGGHDRRVAAEAGSE